VGSGSVRVWGSGGGYGLRTRPVPSLLRPAAAAARGATDRASRRKLELSGPLRAVVASPCPADRGVQGPGPALGPGRDLSSSGQDPKHSVFGAWPESTCLGSRPGGVPTGNRGGGAPCRRLGLPAAGRYRPLGASKMLSVAGSSRPAKARRAIRPAGGGWTEAQALQAKTALQRSGPGGPGAFPGMKGLRERRRTAKRRSAGLPFRRCRCRGQREPGRRGV